MKNTTGGIIFSLFVVVLAAMNLVVDFDFIEQGANSRAPIYGMEWSVRTDGYDNLALCRNPQIIGQIKTKIKKGCH